MFFNGVDAFNSKYVSRELSNIASPEHTYFCQVAVFSNADNRNPIVLLKDLEKRSFYLGYNVEDGIKNVVNRYMIPMLESNNLKPEQVDVIFNIYVGSKENPNDAKVTPYEINTDGDDESRTGFLATNLFIPGLEAVEETILGKELSSCSAGTYKAYLRVIGKEIGVNLNDIEFLNCKYFTFIIDADATQSENEQTMADLADLIADTIEEGGSTPEDVYIALSFWEDDGNFGDGGGGGSGGDCEASASAYTESKSQSSNIKAHSIVSRPLVKPRIKNIIKNRMYSTLNSGSGE